VDDGQASRTAVIVCQGRAAADGRLAPERFADPIATQLLSPDERVPVAQVRTGTVPHGWSARVEYETVRASAEVAVPRTVAIDDAIRARTTPQLILVGAGLDARAWRMPELADIDVSEVDHPSSQADKRSRLGQRRPLARSVQFVPVDFTRDRFDAALAKAGHRADAPTTWVWEGVVPYLTPAEVTTTVEAIAARSAPGSRLIVNYQSPSIRASLGRALAIGLSVVAQQGSPWAREPRRSSWTAATMSRLLVRNGFSVDSDDDLLCLARGLGMPVKESVSLQTGRVAVADR
jgi:methyltransferase (TIGR00027 family)